MIPTVSRDLAFTLIIVAFVVVAAMLLIVLVGSTIRQQRRYLRSRQHLGGRLLTAQDEERAAIAREIHDDAVQRLIASASRLRSAPDPVAVAIAEDLDDLVRDLRGLARGIHPAIVDHVGLDAALGDLCKSLAEREGLTVSYVGPSAPEVLSQPQRLALYRVAQEALGNVARHAGVNQASVSLGSDTDCTRLEIEDRGCGFSPRAVETGPGIGVTSMRERLAILGGLLEVDSAPGSGTRVTATLPHARSAP